MGKSASGEGPSPSELIDGRIAELREWRGKLLARLRAAKFNAARRITGRKPEPRTGGESLWGTWSPAAARGTGREISFTLRCYAADGSNMVPGMRMERVHASRAPLW